MATKAQLQALRKKHGLGEFSRKPRARKTYGRVARNSARSTARGMELY